MLTVDEARALVTTSLSDADLGAVIAREEDWLAQRVGPLSGERVETFATNPPGISPTPVVLSGDEPLLLRRPASTVVVEDDNGTRDDVEVRGWSDVCQVGLPGSVPAWAGPVRVTYTPTDESQVKRSLITLVRLTVNESAYQQQTAGGYSAVTSLADQRQMRYTAWKSLLRPRRTLTSMELRSTIPLGGASLGSVGVEVVGS